MTAAASVEERVCDRCERIAVFIIPTGQLCPPHAISEMRDDQDWIPLRRKTNNIKKTLTRPQY